MIKAVIFDLDGTLIDAYRAIEKSLNYTLSSLGYIKVSYAKARVSVGRGDRNFVAQFVKNPDIEKALDLYRNHHKLSLLRYSKVKPSGRRVLSTLKRRGIKLAVASNRPTKFSHILIDHLDLDKYFALVLCADKKHELKPEPYLLKKILKKLKIKEAETLYVGDMVYDVEAGHNAGIKPVAILGGSDSRKELAKHKPFKIISNLKELLKLS